MGQTIKDRSSAASARVTAATKAASRAAAGEARHHSPFVLGAAAVILALGLSWLAEIVFAFRHDPGLPARERILGFFGIGTIGWAIAVLLAVLFWVLARRWPVTRRGPALPALTAGAPGGTEAGRAVAATTTVKADEAALSPPAAPGPASPPAAARAHSLEHALPVALMASAIAVGGSAVIDLIVELTNFGNGINAAFGGLIAYLAVLPVAGVSAWWVHAERSGARAAALADEAAPAEEASRVGHP
jgi:hypothetical protein